MTPDTAARVGPMATGANAATWHWTPDQVAWAIDHNSDAAVRATRVLLHHAVRCTVTRICPTCRAITEATSDAD